MSEYKCNTCEYFDNSFDGSRIGKCRYQPPTHKGFPNVGADDWCGYHATRYEVETSGKDEGVPLSFSDVDVFLEVEKAKLNAPMTDDEIQRVLQAAIDQRDRLDGRQGAGNPARMVNLDEDGASLPNMSDLSGIDKRSARYVESIRGFPVPGGKSQHYTMHDAFYASGLKSIEQYAERLSLEAEACGFTDVR